MALPTGYNNAGGFGEGIPPDLRSRDLPSKRVLGKGLSSIGYETEWKGERYARKDFMGVPSNIFLNEAAALVRLKDVHPNVVKTHGFTIDKMSCSLVLEYMDDKLSNLLQKRKDQRKRISAGPVSGNQPEHISKYLPFELHEALYFMVQIAKGMEYLHEQGILHGDLNTRNILVTYMNIDDKGFLDVKSVKVADFGLVQTKRNSMSHVSRQVRKLDTIRWTAPENYNKESTSSESDSNSDEECAESSGITLGALLSADVYSFAVTCSQILTGEEPYPRRNWKELEAGILSGKLRPKLPPDSLCPKMLSELLVLCWDTDPDKRPTFSDIRRRLEDIHTPRTIVKEERDQNACLRDQLEKEFIAGSSSLKLMESVEDTSQLSKALRILEDVTKISKNFLMNKHQCERLANRLHAIGMKLRELPKEFLGRQFLDAGNKVDNPAFDVVLTVLRKAKALLSKYAKSEERPSMHTRTEDREAFKEIHAELDMLNSPFHIGDFESSSASMRSAMLRRDAAMDLKELSESLQELARSDEGSQSAKNISAFELPPTSLHHKLTNTLERPQTSMPLKSDLPDDTESEVENSESEVSDSESEVENYGEVEELNTYAFRKLQLHPTLGQFFKTFGYDLVHESAGELVVGEKFAKAAWAELFNAHVTWTDPKYNEYDLEHGQKWALKMFNKGTLLRDLQHQWPHGMLLAFAEDVERLMLGKPLPRRHIVNIFCATLKDGRFAFLMPKEDTDLRSVIDHNVQFKSSQQCGPFPQQVAEGIMYHVALGMNWLHNHDILHRDLKASNVLVSSKYGNYECLVAGFECSIGVWGTGFYRAPEILLALRNKTISARSEVFTKAIDAYSYGMTCYEILTGKFPFEGHSIIDYELVLEGRKLDVPEYVDDWMRKLLTWCWESNPAGRPSFTEILDVLLANSSAIRGKTISYLSDDQRGRKHLKSQYEGKL